MRPNLISSKVARGFLGMQFIGVVATNARALETWQRAGFGQTGVDRASFRLPSAELVATCVLYRQL